VAGLQQDDGEPPPEPPLDVDECSALLPPMVRVYATYHQDRCGVVWCGCGVVWCGVVWCGVVWCCVVWCGVVWCGVVWCGVVWCGVVHAAGQMLLMWCMLATVLWVGCTPPPVQAAIPLCLWSQQHR